MVIGLFAGLVCFYATQFIKSNLKIDDSLDVFPVHGVGGILGIILLAPLGDPSGLLGVGASGFDKTVLAQLNAQLIGVVVIVLWTAVFTWIAFIITNALVGLRVSAEDEYIGLDQTEHNETSYTSN